MRCNKTYLSFIYYILFVNIISTIKCLKWYYYLINTMWLSLQNITESLKTKSLGVTMTFFVYYSQTQSPRLLLQTHPVSLLATFVILTKIYFLT